MKAIVENAAFDASNPVQVAVLRLQCGMEYVAAAMHLYAGEAFGRSPLPDHLSLVTLSLYLAGTAEVLHLFHALARKGILSASPRWSSEVLGAWSFLLSNEVMEFKKQQLKPIRDKTVFHVDPEPVQIFLDEESREQGRTVLMEDSTDHPHGFSPAAITIVGRWLLSQGLASSESAALADRIYSALRKVTSAVMLKTFPSIRVET